MKKYILLLVISLLSVLLSAGTVEVYPLDSPLYDEMEILYLSAGYGTPSNSRPWSKAEAVMILERIDKSALDKAEVELYESISDLLSDEPLLNLDSIVSLDLGADLALESYIHTNPSFNHESDWIYGYDERLPLFRGYIAIDMLDMFYTFCDIRVANGKYRGSDTAYMVADIHPDGIGAVVPPAGELVDADVKMIEESGMYSPYFTHNILLDVDDFDSIFPKRAYVSTGGKHWSLVLGRDRINWGNSHIGNFVVDNHLDYNDFLRFVFFSDKFKYEFLTLFLEYDYSCRQTEDSGSKFLIAHRLEFRPLKNLTFSVSENVMYVSKTGVELKYFNPAFIFHNLDNRSLFNAIASVDLDWQFAKGFNLYAQAVLDQATAPGEGDDQSPAWGILGGIEYANAGESGVFSGSLEVAYTSPLLYRRNNVDFLVIDKNKLSTTGGYVIDIEFLGFPYGNDSLVVQLQADYEFKNGIGLGFTAKEIIKGSLDIFTSHNTSGNNSEFPDIAAGMFYGDITCTTVLSLISEIPISEICSFTWPQLDFMLGLNGILRHRENTNDLQIVLSLAAHF